MELNSKFSFQKSEVKDYFLISESKKNKLSENFQYSKNYTCTKCLSKGKNKIKCTFCYKSEGYLNQINLQNFEIFITDFKENKIWCHNTCFIYFALSKNNFMSKLLFNNNNNINVKNKKHSIKDILPKNFPCEICSDSNNPSLKCCQKNCDTSFHLSCGMDFFYILPLKFLIYFFNSKEIAELYKKYSNNINCLKKSFELLDSKAKEVILNSVHSDIVEKLNINEILSKCQNLELYCSEHSKLITNFYIDGKFFP